VTVSGSIQVQVNAVPTGITFTPSATSLPDNAAAGTTVAAVSVSMSDGSAFTGTLAASPSGTVAISGNKLVLARGLTSADDGSQQWAVSATQNGVTVSSSITVQVTSATPPPPPPPSITVNGSSNAVVAPGASIAVAVANGPANPTDWVAIYNAGDTNNFNHLSWVFLSDTQTPPGTGVSAATVTMTAPNTNGSYEARFYANNTYTILAVTTFTVQGVTPIGITLNLASPSIPDNSPAGSLIATANVTMSDGSTFKGTLTTSNTDIYAISGLNIVTARALTPADDGTHPTVITASQAGQAVSMEFSI